MEKIIDLSSWKRRQHFEVFSQMNFPYFSLTSPLEVTDFFRYVKSRNELRLTPTFLYLATTVANEIPEFRTRIRGTQIIEHSVIHPSPTFPWKEDLFAFSTITMTGSLQDFHQNFHEAAEETKSRDRIITEADQARDDVLYTTTAPWMRLSGCLHPVHTFQSDSIPRLGWGMFFQQNDQWFVDVNIQAHHGLMDGFHVGLFLKKLKDQLDQLPNTL